jgi:hypothetical protein
MMVHWIEKRYNRRRSQRALDKLTPVKFKMTHMATDALSTTHKAEQKERADDPNPHS